ncbi:hypothetical protein VI01_07390 [Pantoea sp. SM3]|nr:hypothetical protein VI01_07390 [Pantoea sp. SM3]
MVLWGISAILFLVGNVSTLNIRLIYKGETCRQEEVEPVILLRMQIVPVKQVVRAEVQAEATLKIVLIALLRQVVKAGKSVAGASRKRWKASQVPRWPVQVLPASPETKRQDCFVTNAIATSAFSY